MAKLSVNKKQYEVDADSGALLLWVLRDDLGLTGTKFGCGVAQCGSCTVHVDGEARRACVTPISSVIGKEITTIEGLSDDNSHPLQKAWIEVDAPQCGYCQPGMIMACAGAMKAGHHGTEILSEMGNVCICGTYQRIKTAVGGL